MMNNKCKPKDKIAMNVCGPAGGVLPTLTTYMAKLITPQLQHGKNMLCQRMMELEKTKYVIKWDFDLDGKTITVPEKCSLEFDGGSLKNGIIIGQDTFINNVGGVADIFGLGIDKQGTWREVGDGSVKPGDLANYYTKSELDSGEGKRPTVNEVEEMISDIPKDVDDHLDATSVNPVQNKVVTEAINNTKKKVENAYDTIFAEHNLLNNPFFESDEGWNVNGLGNGSIEDGKVSIVGKGNVSQEYNFVAKHVYVAVCFAKLDEFFGIDTNNGGYYSKPGIGFRIRSNDTILGAYRINIDNVSIEHVEDYVPVMFVFRNTVNCAANLYFGELYNTGGSVRGSIAHVGLYDITNIADNVTYEKLYFEYKEWIENRLGLYNASRKVVYPDSIAKEAFIERMNDAASYFGLRHSRYCIPSGLGSFGDYFNEGVIYKTIISPSEVRNNCIVNFTGNVVENVADFNVYFYNVVGANTYIVSNLFTEDANRVALISYWEGDKFIGNDPAFRNIVKEYPGKPERTDYRDEVYVRVPVNATRMSIESDVNYEPVLRCYSQAPINASSVEIDSRYDYNTESKVVWSAKTNVVTCRDMAVLVGIAGFNSKMQEALCANDKITAWHDSNGKGEHTLYRTDIDHWKDWYIIMMKSGASDSDGQGNYKKWRYSLLAKNKASGRCFAVAVNREDNLPDYSGNAERENANKWYNLAKGLLDYANNVKKLEIKSFTPVNGVIVVNSEMPDYNMWRRRDDHYVSTLVDVSEYVGGTVNIEKGERNGFFSFLSDDPVAGKPVQYAEGYTMSVRITGTVNTVIPNNAKYLFLYVKEGSVSYAPSVVRLESAPFDFSNIDWDACCVGEIQPEVPFAVNEIDQRDQNVFTSRANIWYGDFRGKNINKAIEPFSTTKLLTSIVALEYLKCSDFVIINENDRVWGSHSNYENGEMMKVEDAINHLIDVSDNILCTSLSRIAGYEILKGRKLYLIDKTVERYNENA